MPKGKRKGFEEDKKLREISSDTITDMVGLGQNEVLTDRFCAFLTNKASLSFTTNNEDKKIIKNADRIGITVGRAPDGRYINSNYKQESNNDPEYDYILPNASSYINLKDSKEINKPKIDNIKSVWNEVPIANKVDMYKQYIDYLVMPKPEHNEVALGFDKSRSGKFKFPDHFSTFLKDTVGKEDVHKYWNKINETEKNGLIASYKEAVSMGGPVGLSSRELQEWRDSKLEELGRSYDPRSREGVKAFEYEVAYTVKAQEEARKSSSIFSSVTDLLSGVAGSVLSMASLSSLFSGVGATNSTNSTSSTTETPSSSPSLVQNRIPMPVLNRNPSFSPTPQPALSLNNVKGSPYSPLPTRSPDQKTKEPTEQPTGQPSSYPSPLVYNPKCHYNNVTDLVECAPSNNKDDPSFWGTAGGIVTMTALSFIGLLGCAAALCTNNNKREGGEQVSQRDNENGHDF